MNNFTFTKEAFEQYMHWQAEDKKTLTRINTLLKDILSNGTMEGTGKPEKLKYRPGYSRRIDDTNRLVYDIDELRNILIISCKGHYED
ncbi:MAG: Txe/YoeB family addiction module toxin [Lachnospiraceae bacterium]|nr:Txe/YoeB family addiction module toxin [Lachnospiraceae bacterium]